MVKVKKKLRDVKVSQISFRFYQFLFDLLICLMAALIVSRLIVVPIMYSVIPFVFFVFFATFFEFHEWNIVNVIRKSNSHLDERLQTAIEADEGNPIAEFLINDVSEDIDNISDSTFIKPKSIGYRIFALFTLSFVLLTLGYLGFFYGKLEKLIDDVPFDDLRNRAKQITGLQGVSDSSQFEDSNYSNEEEPEKVGSESGGEAPGYSEGPIPGTGGGAGSDGNTNIFGESSSASLEGKDLDFKLNPEYGGNIEIRETSTGNSIDYGEFGFADSAEACKDCQVGPEYEELVRNYFQKLTQS